jgi:polyphenol oxidase
VRAAIGPGAGGCCYAVGADVASVFGVDAGLVDLKTIARERLRAAGVREIHDVGLCTICSDPELFFSHRRDGGVTGRQAGIAWRS